MRRFVPPALRRPLAVFALALALGVAAWTFASHLRHEAFLEREWSERDWRAAQTALDELPARIALVERSDALYDDLVRRGFIGMEQRLRWISALSRLQAELGLDELSWRLGAQEASSTVANLGASRMELRVTPLAAAELRPFLERLALESGGLFTVEHCELALADSLGHAECRLVWWTWRGGGARP